MLGSSEKLGASFQELAMPGGMMWYVDKLRLDNGSELNLLASVGNTYDLAKLQEAAVVQDRMNRRIWETKRQDPKKNHVYMAEVEDTSDGTEDMEDLEHYDGDEAIGEHDEETHEAFVAFKNAKAKYNNVLKARGAVTSQGREEALQRAKQRSDCSACGKKGHWHKDPICPKNKNNGASGQATHTTHIVHRWGDCGARGGRRPRLQPHFGGSSLG